MTARKIARPRCRGCGASLPAPTGRGRPPAWCTDGCRRAAEYRIRRIDRRLLQLEDALFTVRLNGGDPAPFDEEHARLELELRELLEERES